MGNVIRRPKTSSGPGFELMDDDTDKSASLRSTDPIFKPGGILRQESLRSTSLTTGEDVEKLPTRDTEPDSDLDPDHDYDVGSSHDLDRHVHLWKAGFLVFTVLNCLLFALLVKVCVLLAEDSARQRCADNVTSANTSSSASLEDSPFCLPCSEVYLNDIEVLQNRSKVAQRRMEGGADNGNDAVKGRLCCAEPHDDLRSLVGKLFIRVHYARDRASGLVTVANDTDDVTNEEDVVRESHLRLQFDRKGESLEINGTHTVPLMLAKRSAPTSSGEEHGNSSSSDSSSSSSSPFSSSSVLLRQGAVTIVHPGHFYVSSHVPFTFSPRLQPRASLTQYVVRVRNGGEEALLLENSVFPCDVSLQSCEHSFAGGVFLLESGDRVVLRVSDLSHVEREEVEFGVHRL